MKLSLVSALLGLCHTILVAGSPSSKQDNYPHHENPDFGHCGFPVKHDFLPIFSLGGIVSFPTDELQNIIKSGFGDQKLTHVETKGGQLWSDGHHLVASIDKVTGETAVFPKLSALKPGKPKTLDVVLKYLRHSGIFPSDDTTISHIQGSALSGSQSANGTETPAAVYLTDVVVLRNITHDNSQYRVLGPGTKGIFRIDAGGNVISVSHRWQKADRQRSSLVPLPQEKVTGDITQQLLSAGFDNTTIDTLELVFYDGGKGYIQPAYRYTATKPSQFANISSTHITGFVAAASGLPEQLPTITPPKNNGNITTPRDTNSTVPIVTRRVTKRQTDTITTGRYIMNHNVNSPDFINEASAFETSLLGNNLGGIFGGLFGGLFGSLLNFIDAQYYWDRRFIYTTSKETFIDAVDVAFTIGHGNVHQVCTDDSIDDCERFYIGNTDFGPVNLGTESLRYWIIHSCLVIPTPVDYFKSTDSHKAWDPWWVVFNGLHAVVGMREEVDVYDGTSSDFATRIAHGESVVFAWLSSKNDFYANYGIESDWGLDGQPYLKSDRYGSPSAVNVCGHADDTLFDSERLPQADCLEMYWYGNPTWQDCGPDNKSPCVSVTPS